MRNLTSMSDRMLPHTRVVSVRAGRERIAAWLLAMAVVSTMLPGMWQPSVASAAPPAAPARPGRATAAAAPVVGTSSVGVWTGSPSTGQAATFDDLGTGWARLTVAWSTIEPTLNTFNWSALDQQIAAASGGGRRNVLALVRDNPSWAAALPCTLTTDLERTKLARFMGTLAGRYRGVVWQLYNEEDNVYPSADAQYGLGGCFGTSLAGVANSAGRINYARTIEAVASAIRTADPTAQLAAGGVASGNFVSPVGGAFDPGFLPGVLAQLKLDGSLASLDYVSVHYYSSQSVSYSTGGTDLIGRVSQLRQDIMAAGLTSAELKPVLSDELSYTDLAGVSTTDSNNAFNRGQRAYVPKLFARAAAADVRAAFWFWINDQSAGLGSDVPYGIMTNNGGQKPSYRAMKYFNSVIASSSQFARTLDLSALSPTLEGYEFTARDTTHAVQIVWNQADATQFAYSPPGTISSVTDPEGNAVAWSGGTVTVGAEPRYITYSAVPIQLLPQPVRLVDTRANTPYQGSGQFLRGYTTPNCYAIGGTAGIPATATGVLLNITTSAHSVNGYVTLYPAGGTIPATSNLNFAPLEIAVANSATVKLGVGGQVCAIGTWGAQLILDAVGYLADVGPAGQIQLLSQPARLVDTRPGLPYLGSGQALQGYNTPSCFTLAGLSGIPQNAAGVLLTVTATGHPALGYLTVYPGGASIPSTSNLNFVAEIYATAASATVRLGNGGQVCVVGLAGTQVLIDAVGYLAVVTGTPPVQLLSQPVRLVDTRTPSSYLGAGQPLQGYTTPNCYALAGLGGIPSNAAGVLLNITSAQHPGNGYLTVYPNGGAIPPTSNVNFQPFEYAIANSATVKVGTSGQVCAVGMAGTQLIVDAVGFLSP